MDIYNLKDFVGGWILGDFEPTILNVKHFEVAIKSYSKGDLEQKHFHKISKEITVIASGKVKMNNKEYVKGDIILIDKNESTDFYALEDSITVVVKIPSVKNDKYFIK